MEINLTQLDHRLECSRRGLYDDDSGQQNLLAYQLSGHTAEEDLARMLRATLPSSWKLYRNVYINHRGKTEVDILIVTPKFWWIWEVKFYNGHFSYTNAQCYYNGEQIRDEVGACRNRRAIIQRVANTLSHQPPAIVMTMVFMNNDYDVTFDQKPDFYIIQRYQINRHIREVMNLNFAGYTDVSLSVTAIMKHQVENPFQPTPLSLDTFSSLRKGIACEQCGSYDIATRHKTLVCNNCKTRELKSRAIIRSACSLCVLYFDDPKILTISNLHKFINGILSVNSVRNIILKHFKQYSKGPGTYYENYALPFEKIKDKFDI